VPEERRALDTGGVHHRPDVVHPLLERRHAADAVGRPRAALVEADDPHAIRQLAEIVAGELFVELHRRKVEAAREDEVGRPRAEDAIGDVDLAALRVSGIGALHATKSYQVAQREKRIASPTLRCVAADSGCWARARFPAVIQARPQGHRAR